MRYSILPPRSDSPGWKIVDELGEVVFSGLQPQCEEWLDLVDLRTAARTAPVWHAVDRETKRPPIFELASAFLGRFCKETDGEVRVSGELPSIVLLLMIMAGFSSQFVGAAVVQHAALVGGAAAAVCAGPSKEDCDASHSGACCANSIVLDMACDAVDDAP